MVTLEQLCYHQPTHRHKPHPYQTLSNSPPPALTHSQLTGQGCPRQTDGVLYDCKSNVSHEVVVLNITLTMQWTLVSCQSHTGGVSGLVCLVCLVCPD